MHFTFSTANGADGSRLRPRRVTLPPRVAAALAVLLLLSAPGAAQTLPLPEPPPDGLAARNSFPDRADPVVRVNACGREDVLLAIRAEMSQGDFSRQGEPLTALLIAKTAWLTGPGSFGRACETEVAYGVPEGEDPVRYAMAKRADWDRELQARWDAAPSSARCTVTREAMAPSSREVRLKLSVDADCMRRQVNDSILAMRKTAQMGTDGLTCGPVEALDELIGARGEGVNPRPGDWDVNVKELVRLLYAGTAPNGRAPPVLDAGTVDHMYAELLSARGEVGDDSYSLIAGCDNPAGEELGSPEDTGDRRAWYNDVARWLGDAFKWLTETILIRIPTLAATNFVGGAALPFLLITGNEVVPPHLDVRMPETENHRLMIESSRYLTNADIIQRLKAIDHDNVDDLEEEQVEVRAWLLAQLNVIARNDFFEYNSRPYGRYSLTAVQNLHDLVREDRDREIRTAARIVLDLSQAKFAAGSNRARRAPPFRRLSDMAGQLTSDGVDEQARFYNAVEGADHEVARTLLYAGQTQLLGPVPLAGIDNLIYAAVGDYRPPLPVLDTAVRRPLGNHVFAHASVELYTQAPAFTISAGGLRSPPQDLFGFSRDIDRGSAQPTMVIPTSTGDTYRKVFMFRGLGEAHERTENLCVHGNFACGIRPWLADLPDSCLERSSTPARTTVFVNSAQCSPRAEPHYFLVAVVGTCTSFCSPGQQWGLYEIVAAAAPPEGVAPAADPAFVAFKRSRAAALTSADPDGSGVGTYVNTHGSRIRFRINDARPQIESVDDRSIVPASTTGLVTRDASGLITIGAAGEPGRVEIDVRDPEQPRRSEP